MCKTVESSFLAKERWLKKGYCENEGLELFLIKSRLKIRFDAKKMQIIWDSKHYKRMCGFIPLVPFLSKIFG